MLGSLAAFRRDSPVPVEEILRVAVSAGRMDSSDRDRVLALNRLVRLSPEWLLDEVGLEGGGPNEPGPEFGDFGRYRILGCLGEGGMGSVFLARDHELCRNVALKLMHATLQTDRQQRRFRREAAVMARVKHPGCVEVYDVGLTSRGEPFLVMEYVEGQNLQAVLQEQGPADQRAVSRWGRDLAEALEACHAEGVLHRDVKPSNVLLTPAGSVRLTDFGVAHDAQANTQLTQGAVGTLLYMAPELIDGAPPTATSEVYALGATMYELLSGAPPFPGPTHLELLRQVAGSEVQGLRVFGVAPDLDRVLQKCLCKVPNERYSSARELALDLGRFLAGEPVSARPVSIGVRLARLIVRRRTAFGSSLAAAVAAVGLMTGVYTWSQRQLEARAQERLRAAEALLTSGAGIAAIDSAESLIEEGRRSPSRSDQEWAEVLNRRAVGLRVHRHALERLMRHRVACLELQRLGEPVDYQEPPAVPLADLISIDTEEARLKNELYPEVLQGHAEVERLLVAAREFVSGGQVQETLADLELLTGKALAEFWPSQAELHLKRAEALGANEAAIRQPVVEFQGRGRGSLLGEPGTATRNFRLPCRLELSVDPFRGRIQPTGGIEFGFALFPRRGQQRQIAAPTVREKDLPALLRSELAAVVGGQPRTGLQLRRVRQHVKSFLMLKTEVSREMALSFLVSAAARIRRDGSPVLTAVAMGGLRLLAQPGSRQLPCTSLDGSDIKEMMEWLQREFALAGSPYVVRLPGPLEFHYALRSDYLIRFPWGNQLYERLLVPGLRHVGSDPLDVSPLGVSDLGGSLSEIVLGNQTGQRCFGLLGSFDGASRGYHFAAPSEFVGYRGNFGQDGSTGFRFVVDLTHHPELGWKQSLPRSLELQEVAIDLLRGGQFRQAYEQATKALQAHNKNVEAWTIRGHARLALADNWGAWWDCAQALELEPDNANPRLWGIYGRAVARSHRWEKAIPICTKALALNEEDSSLYFFRGWSRAELGQHVEALVDLKTHLKRMPDSANRLQALELIKACKESLAQQGLGR